MNKNTKLVIKDSTALGLITSSSGLFALRLCQVEGSLSRAARNAITGATVVAPLAGAAVFVLSKADRLGSPRDETLEATVVLGGAAALIAAAVSGIASLAWDAFRN
jgi:hypothetical protein